MIELVEDLGGPLLLIALLPVILILSLYLWVEYKVRNPIIVSHPYPKYKDVSRGMVSLAGSYNPPHLGHLAMLRYLSERHDTVYAIIGFNPRKKYAVTPQARIDMVKRAVEEAGLKNVKAVLVEGLIWRWCARKGVGIMYRGVRSWGEDGADESKLAWQNYFYPFVLGPFTRPVDTVFLEGDPSYNHISSTVVRNLADDGNIEALSNLVPKVITDDVIKSYREE